MVIAVDTITVVRPPLITTAIMADIEAADGQVEPLVLPL
jgi:hypothetical protein